MSTFLIFILVFLLICFGLLYVLQRKLVYFPEPFRTQPASVGLVDIEEIELKTDDGETLIAWYLKAQPGKPTLLYFHGNGGALRYRAERFLLHQENGTGLLMLSYRGYSGSSGQPTEANNVKDALLTYDWLIAAGVDSKKIFLYGESLGTGVAVQIASQRKVSGVILEAPYSSLTDVGQNAYPFLPVRLLMKDRYESIKFVARINAPLLILHGTLDTIVPLEYGKKLFEAAVEPKEIVIYPKGSHSDLMLHGAWGTLLEFMNKNSIAKPIL